MNDPYRKPTTADVILGGAMALGVAFGVGAILLITLEATLLLQAEKKVKRAWRRLPLKGVAKYPHQVS